MRFSVFAYSQEKLLENGLDVTDALILDWFANFFLGKMDKKIFKDENGNQAIFGWVKISKIMEDLPVLGISTEKGIRRRLDSFIEKGIMKRQTITTQDGKRSYYKTTELYDSLINTKAVTEKSEKAENQTETKENISQRNSNTYAENKNPQRTKTTLANENSDKNIPQRNSNTYAQRNSSSLALNDSQINNSKINLKNPVAVFKFASEKVFGKNSFDLSFPQKAAVYFSQNKINSTLAESYLDFIKIKVDSKKSQNPRGLAYRLFFQNDILQEFLNKTSAENTQKIENEKYLCTCPVCSTQKVNRFSYCPVCNFDMQNLNDKKQIEISKKIFNLPAEKKESFENEIKSVVFRRQALGIRLLSSKESQQNFNLEMNEIYKKYGIEA